MVVCVSSCSGVGLWLFCDCCISWSRLFAFSSLCTKIKIDHSYNGHLFSIFILIGYVVVVPWFAYLYVEIIHELKDYVHYYKLSVVQVIVRYTKRYFSHKSDSSSIVFPIKYMFWVRKRSNSRRCFIYTPKHNVFIDSYLKQFINKLFSFNPLCPILNSN